MVVICNVVSPEPQLEPASCPKSATHDVGFLRSDSRCWQFRSDLSKVTPRHWCRRWGCKRTPRSFDSVKIWAKWCDNLCKIAWCALIWKKWQPKSKRRRFFEVIVCSFFSKSMKFGKFYLLPKFYLLLHLCSDVFKVGAEGQDFIVVVDF